MQIPYTKPMENVIKQAGKIARERKHPYIGTEHLLLALRKEYSGVAGQVLAKNGVDAEKISRLIDELVAPDEEVKVSTRPEQSPRFQFLLKSSEQECGRLHTEYVGTEHLLLAMIRDVDCVATRILITLNVNLQKLFQDIMFAVGIDPKEYQDSLQDEPHGGGGNGGTVLYRYDSPCRRGKTGPGHRKGAGNVSSDGDPEQKDEE